PKQKKKENGKGKEPKTDSEALIFNKLCFTLLFICHCSDQHLRLVSFGPWSLRFDPWNRVAASCLLLLKNPRSRVCELGKEACMSFCQNEKGNRRPHQICLSRSMKHCISFSYQKGLQLFSVLGLWQLLPASLI
ncbi:hypothetical protein V8G54_013968, partial [Vigna mungo]